MAYLLGVLLIAVGVAFSIALHEVGHLVPAKRFGVKCTQYMVGFGPTIWSRKSEGGETEYGLKAIPLGGYVRMVGMFPPAPGRPARADTTGRWSLMVEQARAESQREVADVPKDRLFYTKPVWQRLIIMLGGPTMNLIIAVVLLTGILVGYGLPQIGSTVSSITDCVPASASATGCTSTDAVSPAKQAGLQSGDKIVSLNGTPVPRATAKVSPWTAIRKQISASAGKTLSVGVIRDGRHLALQITPVASQRLVYDKNNNPVLGPDGKQKVETVGYVGVSPADTHVRQPLSAVPSTLGTYLKDTGAVVVHFPSRIVNVAQAAFGHGTRDPNGPISVVGVGRIAGQVASDSGSATTGPGPSVFDRIMIILSLLMSLNLALFVLNLIPLLPLDGGHVAGALWEGLRRQVAKVRQVPDPGPVDVARALPVAYGVASLLIGMSVLLIYADVVRPVSIGN